MTALAYELMDLAARAAIVLAAAWIVTATLRRASAATRHLVWTLAVAGVLALPAIHAALPAWEVLPAIDRSAEALRHTRPATFARAQPFSVAEPSAVAQPSPVAPPLAVAQPFGAAYGSVLLMLWSLVAVLLLARIALGVCAIGRLGRHAHPANERWRTLLRRLAPADAHRIRLLVSGDIAMPMTWGSRRPLLLLPADAAGWSDDRATVVLLHELAHVRRADWLTHALARSVVALHWFNPIAWVALRAMTRERERACDDHVLSHGARASEYARHLLDIARAETSGAIFAVAPAMARASELEGRLLAILTPRRRHAGRAARAALPLAALAATGIVAAAAPSVEHRQAPPSDVPAQRGTRSPRNILLGDALERDDRSRPVVNALAAALDDPSPSVREKAALGLALRSGPAVVDPLLRALKDSSSQVREKAAIGLAMRQGPRVVDALLAAMDDPDSQVREKVVIALGLSGEARVQEALVAALSDPDEQVREKAAQALATFPLADAVRGGIAGALQSFGIR